MFGFPKGYNNRQSQNLYKNKYFMSFEQESTDRTTDKVTYACWFREL